MVLRFRWSLVKGAVVLARHELAQGQFRVYLVGFIIISLLSFFSFLFYACIMTFSFGVSKQNSGRDHRQNTGLGAGQQKMVLDCIGSSFLYVGHDVRIY